MPRLVLVGGGHAHMTVMSRIRDIISRGHEVILISPVERHSYSGMSPGMLGGIYTPEDISFPLRKIVEPQGARMLEDAVTRVLPGERQLELATGERLSYDVASFNVGSQVSDLQTDSPAFLPVKPVSNLLQARQRLRKLCGDKREFGVVVIGGGPAAVEVAGNVWRAAQDFGGKPKIRLLAGSRLLKVFPDRVRRLALHSLQERGIAVDEGSRAQEVHGDSVRLQSGGSVSGDLILGATGVHPPKLFADSGLQVGPDNGLAVNHHLQSVQAPEIFGGGDCIHFMPRPLAKVGVYAVRENPILAHNLLAALEGTELKAFEPGGGYLLILNLGDGTAVLRKGFVSFRSQVAMALKDYIDRAFMKKFKP